MKRIGFFIGSLILSTTIYAQNDVDALKYSWNNILSGTARSTAMGGAFSALGGDVSVLSTNPAGLGVYRTSEFVFTPTLFYNRTEADYLKSTYSDEKYNFNLNTLAYVGSITSGLSNGWESINFAISYNRKNNYNRNVLISGIMDTANLNPGSSPHSYLDNFTYYATLDDPNGTHNPDEEYYVLDPHYEELAYNTDLILYYNDTLNGGFWWNEFNDDGYNQQQRRAIKTSGSSGEYNLAMGANYNHSLYIGASVGYHHFREEYVSIHTETDDLDVIDYIHDFQFEENYTTWGHGIDFKMGLIYKPIELIRISGAFHTPTFYKVNLEYSNSAESSFDPDEGVADMFSYSYEVGYYDYKLRTPLKAIGGIAFQIEKIALLSFDYEYMDYGRMNMSSDTEDEFSETNHLIKEKYKATHNVRGGFELRGGPLSLRGGAAYYDSPFNSDEVNKDAYSIFYTGGIGVRSEDFFIDFAYVYGMHKEKYYLYYLPEEEFGEIDPAELKSIYNKFMVTVGFKF